MLPFLFVSATAAILVSLLALFLVRPRAWLPVYLIALATAPQITVGSIPISPTTPILAAAVLAVLLRRLRLRDSRVGLFAPVPLTVLLVASLLASSLNALALWGPSAGLISLMKFVRIAESFVPLLLLTTMHKYVDEEYLRRILKTVLVAGILAAILGLVSVVSPKSFYTLYAAGSYGFTVPGEFGAVWRAVGVFLDPNHLSSFLTLVLLLTLTMLSSPRLGASRALCLTTGIVCLIAMCATFSRAGFVNLIAAVAIYIFLSRDLNAARKVAFVAVCLLFCAGIGYAVYSLLPSMFVGLSKRLASTILLVGAGEMNRASSGRLDVWTGALNAFSDHPYVGIGYKMLPLKYTMADNNYLCFLAEGGLFGLTVWLLWLLEVLLCTLRLLKRHPLGAYLTAAWVGMLVNMLTADLMTYWRTIPVFFIVLGLTTIVARRQESGPCISSPSASDAQHV